jgi:ribonuclease HII
MTRAVEALSLPCDHLLIDAIRINSPIAQTPLIHGDSISFSIAAASILAKVARDAALARWGQVFPEYGFASNKGYGTRDHLEALEHFGPTNLHRFSFEPVRRFSDPRIHPAWDGYPGDPYQAELFPCL